MEALWPEEDPEKLSNRLSVALSTVRGVLDPERHFQPEHYVPADGTTVALDLSNLRVDVEGFLADANEGLSLRRAGRRREADAVLAAAEAEYTGDFLEENAYEDWAVPLREEARATYISVARALAEDALRSNDREAAIRLNLRILERDRYDEQAHLGLVSALLRAGSHGEARRAYLAYASRMEELVVEPAPFPGRGGLTAAPVTALREAADSA
jgi:DNA-binding SARP family transcriptional activator